MKKFSFIFDNSYKARYLKKIISKKYKNLNIYIVCQVYNQVPPQIRKNIDLLFLFKPKTKMETESVINDYFIMPRAKVLELFDFIYRDRYDFLLLDLTLRKGAKYLYFRNYNEIIINQENNHI